ncbi:hypothetical protein ACFQZS_16750 [Mucilaginibacter calamicampi]|uniref:Uncharacterized protein n=1 Tax=Mucilaginibacter calamicampi TaxID=1302352 RepID=A0ABW2YZZ9_9SPHI
MNNRNKRSFACFLFMIVFSTKMMISIIPIFSMLDANIAASVIMQLEQESKNDKSDTDKDAFKEKKNFDEHIYSFFDYKPVLVETNCLHNQEKALAVRLYHKVVPTPPPNV